jgi:hypothetical protein
MSDRRPVPQAEVTRVLRRAGYTGQFINEVVHPLPDPIDLEVPNQVRHRS